MILLDVFAWWYTLGWAELAHRVGARLNKVMALFSVSLLVKTLFDPFKQIDAVQVQGSLQQQVHAFGDRLFSRVIGMFVRLATIFCGLTVAVLAGLVGAVQVVLWPLVPLMPIIGLGLTLVGFIP